MQENAYNTGKMIQTHITGAEKAAIKHIIRILLSKEINKACADDLKRLLEDYYYSLCNKGGDYTVHFKTRSAHRILRFLLAFPVKYNIDTYLVETLYDKYWLIDVSTYVYYQLTAKSIRPKTIDRFMNYIKDTSIEKLCVFCLFRVNPEHIRNTYVYNDVSVLTKRELFYGVSTGYYKIVNGTNPAIERLVELGAEKELAKLIEDGFWII